MNFKSVARFRWKLHRLRRLDRRRIILLLEASVWLALARMALLTMRFPHIVCRLGQFLSPEEGLRLAFPAVPSSRDRELASVVGWAVTRAARHVPFKAVCLPQAMAAKMMLRRRGVGSVLSFGLTEVPKVGLESHAWLTAAGVEVTGYPVRCEFTELACFY